MDTQTILKRYGLVVYDEPQPHIPMEDLKLALGSELYLELVRNTLPFVTSDNGVLGVEPGAVARFLSKDMARPQL